MDDAWNRARVRHVVKPKGAQRSCRVEEQRKILQLMNNNAKIPGICQQQLFVIRADRKRQTRREREDENQCAARLRTGFSTSVDNQGRRYF